jgi:hypothetical protein
MHQINDSRKKMYMNVFEYCDLVLWDVKAEDEMNQCSVEVSNMTYVDWWNFRNIFLDLCCKVDRVI